MATYHCFRNKEQPALRDSAQLPLSSLRALGDSRRVRSLQGLCSGLVEVSKDRVLERDAIGQQIRGERAQIKTRLPSVRITNVSVR